MQILVEVDVRHFTIELHGFPALIRVEFREAVIAIVV